VPFYKTPCKPICLSVGQPDLYIDGEQFVTSRHNPHVVDDWPLHLDRRVHSTKLVIGACWQGCFCTLSVCLSVCHCVCLFFTVCLLLHLSS